MSRTDTQPLHENPAQHTALVAADVGKRHHAIAVIFQTGSEVRFRNRSGPSAPFLVLTPTSIPVYKLTTPGVKYGH